MRYCLPKISLCVLVALSSHRVVATEKQTQKDENEVEKLIITSTPLGRSVLESSTPVTILSGEKLDKNHSATLGETLKSVPGVNSTYFGPVSSSPIIRGLDGPRVKVVQNGMDSSDASRVGPDHLTTTETTTATQIEVLRGPATLLFGSGAIGGVVNVVDNRIPKTLQEDLSATASVLYDSVSNERTFATDINGGSGKLAWHLDAYNRKTDDYTVPEFELEDGDVVSQLDNSFIDSQGFTLGAGWITSAMTLGFAFGQLKTDYGIPGHAHHEHEEHEENEIHNEAESQEEAVFAKMQQDRFQSAVDWKNLSSWITELHWHNAYTNYQHSEIEDAEVGTTFTNDSFESRLWGKHAKINGWQGVIGLHYMDSDFSAQGDEAFTPSTNTTSAAVFVLEEKESGDFLYQLGARIEQVAHQPDNAFFNNNAVQANFDNLKYTVGSVSAGFVYQLGKQQSLALNYALSERAPSAAEIFSNGLHISTSTYEVGAGFDVVIDESDANDVEFTLVQSAQKVKIETANNLDFTYRIQTEHIHANVSVFYNQVDDYLFQQNTGLAFHDHDEEPSSENVDHPEHEEDGSPVYVFTQQDAKLYGFEADIDWHLNQNLRVSAFTDFTRAKLINTGNENVNLPRIPPMRVGANFHWEQDDWHAELGATYYAKQDKIADFESQTDGYTLLSASFNYYLSVANTDLTLFARANNLTNTLARVHSSFLKDDAPLPARSFVIGLKASF
ncbi:MAG: TonB-dependent receptor [Paraglaciecola sp.]|nr:TonB-dependent receptor [Paraglaciecola sp.]NCT48855.1 TonB-dependent receptor [Paraglaciecola sp.]